MQLFQLEIEEPGIISEEIQRHQYSDDHKENTGTFCDEIIEFLYKVE